jgi:hypothetical protein
MKFVKLKIYRGALEFQQLFKMMNLAIFIALGMGANLVAANTPIDNSVFTSDPLTAVQAAAPLWHFDEKTCFPTAATQPDGSQTPSIMNDDCAILDSLDAGCPVQAPQTQQEQLSTSFPTYYTIRQCSKDNSWRVVYDVFFQKVGPFLILRLRADFQIGYWTPV